MLVGKAVTSQNNPIDRFPSKSDPVPISTYSCQKITVVALTEIYTNEFS